MATMFWKAFAETPFPWEREALEFVRAGLPIHDPYRAWANFEFIADDGSVNEVDLLVLTPVGLFLVEIKSRPGVLRGDASTWTWETEGKRYTDDNPYLLANHKAKRLKGLLESQRALRMGRDRLPFIEALVFCSAPDLDIQLQGNGAFHVCRRDRVAREGKPARPGILAALTRRECPGLDPRVRQACDRSLARALSQAFEQAGIRASQKARKVSDYVLERLLFDGPGYQDWSATHVRVGTVKRRVRLYLVRNGATKQQRATIEDAALREFRILETLDHPGILKAAGFTEHEIGPALVFEDSPQAVRLDHLLAERGANLPLAARLEILRRTAEALDYAHGKKAYHRALSPQSILIEEREGRFLVKLINWQAGFREGGTTGGMARTVSGTVHLEQVVEDASLVYMAPEALTEAAADGAPLDVFSLGAVAYLLLSGEPPAADAAALAGALREGHGLQISAVLNGAGPQLQDLIAFSTHPEVSSRLDSVKDFLELLDQVEEEITAPEKDYVEDPAEARPGDRIAGGYAVEKRIGTGAGSVVLEVSKLGGSAILKVAASPEHDARIREEAEVLKDQRHPNVVELLELLDLDGRPGLLMASAGEETLADRLRREGKLRLDLLQRFGEDLLQVLKHLEERGIAHRDIKPDNIGVRKVGKDKTLHLVLFDFSLSRTPWENIRAGTINYLDPFLESRKPPRWDLHAERFAAAVTLYEMATGSRPRWGDGKSAPAALDCEATIEADLLEPGARDALRTFFVRAFRRKASERFDNAEQMLKAWQAAFLERGRPAEDEEASADLAKRLAAATLETQIPELGLSTRANNALDRENVLNVADLLAYPSVRLNHLRGVGSKTKKEILEAVKALRLRLGAGAQERAEAEPEAAEPEDRRIETLAERLTRAAWKKKDAPSRALLLRLLALEAEGGDPWPTMADVGREKKVSRERVRQVLQACRKKWARDTEVAELRSEIADLVSASGGVLTVDVLCEALAASRGSELTGEHRRMVARALVRIASEAERAGASPRFAVHREGDRLFAAAAPELAGYALRLGAEADRLAAGDDLVSPHRVLETLRAVQVPEGFAPLSDPALLRLAVGASTRAALSSRQEIYPRGLPALKAVRLSQGALIGAGDLSEDELRGRISSRYPECEPIPPRPALDRLLKDAGLDLVWDPAAKEGKGAYASPVKDALAPSSATPSFHRLPTAEGPARAAEVTPEEASAREFEDRLDRAARDRSFLVLSVEPRRFYDAMKELAKRWDVEAVDLEARFLAKLREQAEGANARWEKVLQADAAPRDSRDWRNLSLLVGRALPSLEKEIEERKRIVLLYHAGFLSRYESLGFLERLRDKTGRKGGIPGLWTLLPADDQSPLPMMDGVAVPILAPGQRTRVPEAWVRNVHRA